MIMWLKLPFIFPLIILLIIEIELSFRYEWGWVVELIITAIQLTIATLIYTWFDKRGKQKS